MRQIKADEDIAYFLSSQPGGLSEAQMGELNAWSELSAERRGWFEEKYEAFLGRVLEEWGGEKGGTRVVWRTFTFPSLSYLSSGDRNADGEESGSQVPSTNLDLSTTLRKTASLLLTLSGEESSLVLSLKAGKACGRGCI